MSRTAATAAPKGKRLILPFLRLPKQGEPYLAGPALRRVRRRLPRATGSRAARSAPGAGRSPRIPLSKTRRALRLVDRAPVVSGVPVPYVVGVVDLPEGVSVRCNLIDVEPDPKALRFGMKRRDDDRRVASRTARATTSWRSTSARRGARIQRSDAMGEVIRRRRRACCSSVATRTATSPTSAARPCLQALDDAGSRMRDVEYMAAGCLLQANAMVGQRILHEIGQTGIPVVNVANACATGSTAFREA